MGKYYYVACNSSNLFHGSPEVAEEIVYIVNANNKKGLYRGLNWLRFDDEQKAFEYAKSFGIKIIRR